MESLVLFSQLCVLCSGKALGLRSAPRHVCMCYTSITCFCVFVSMYMSVLMSEYVNGSHRSICVFLSITYFSDKVSIIGCSSLVQLDLLANGLQRSRYDPTLHQG